MMYMMVEDELVQNSSEEVPHICEWNAWHTIDCNTSHHGTSDCDTSDRDTNDCHAVDDMPVAMVAYYWC